MALLVRTWNVFHGNADPPERRSFLEQAVRLAAADGPDVVCLQEVPVWALRHLGEWSGMAAFGEVARRPNVGPVPATAEIGRLATSLHHGLFRSFFAGQANAVLLGPELRPLDRNAIVLNPRAFRREQARWLRLPAVARLAWAKERRVCQAVRARLPDGRTAVFANLHATSYPADRRLPDAELLRAAVFADAIAQPRELCVLAGDFNVSAAGSRTLADLTQPEWGFSKPGTGIDHVLVRGAEAGVPARWRRERRRVDGRTLSDHAPVDLRVA